MQPLSEQQIRRSMVNCSRGEAAKMPLPPNLDTLDWESLDYVGWRDAKAPLRAYLVTWRDGEPVGVALRVADASGARKVSAMCSLCRSTRTGGNVGLFTAKRAGESGRLGNSVGTYVCSDLACSRNARLAKSTREVTVDGTLDPEQRSEGVRTRLAKFIDEVLAG